jgi:hypothetical protein
MMMVFAKDLLFESIMKRYKGGSRWPMSVMKAGRDWRDCKKLFIVTNIKRFQGKHKMLNQEKQRNGNPSKIKF